MRRNRSYTYELVEQSLLLSKVKSYLKELGDNWKAITDCMPMGHVEYKPIRNNPMRSGYQFQYRPAGLNLNLYFPEKQFNLLLEELNEDKLLKLKATFQKAIPERSGYIINEFKIRGILDEPLSGEKKKEN